MDIEYTVWIYGYRAHSMDIKFTAADVWICIGHGDMDIEHAVWIYGYRAQYGYMDIKFTVADVWICTACGNNYAPTKSQHKK